MLIETHLEEKLQGHQVSNSPKPSY